MHVSLYLIDEIYGFVILYITWNTYYLTSHTEVLRATDSILAFIFQFH